MTPDPQLTPQGPLGYQSLTGTSAEHGPRRVIAGIVLMLLGLPFIGYYSLGAMFVAGAIGRHEPSVSWRDVGMCVLWVLGGIALFATGLVLVTRRTKTFAAV